MLPTQVRFSGLDLDPRDLLLGRVVSGPIDPTWRRVRFEVAHGVGNGVGKHTIEPLNRWLAANLNARWAIYTVFRFANTLIVIAFESDVDAVMFRLKGG